MAKFKIRQIDAWASEEGQWYWNNSFVIGEFTTRWKDEKRAFLYNLHKLGILFKRGKIAVVLCDDGIYEVQERKTGMPLFAAIPISRN